MAEATITQSDIYYKKDNGKQDILFVAFSALQAGAQQQFQFYNSLSKKSHDTVFIKDDQDLWYQFGAKDVGKNIDEMASRIKEIASKYSQVVFVGPSMGGYVALALTPKIQPDVTIVPSAQSFIDKQNRLKYVDLRWSNKMAVIHAKSEYTSYEDLQRIYRENTSIKTKIYMLYGEYDTLDRIHTIRMAEFPSVRIYEVKGTMHWSALAMRESGIFTAILDNAASKKEVISGIDPRFLIGIKDY